MELPELIEPRRLSWNQVLVALGSLVGGWALILVLINASHSISTIKSAQWGWVVATVLLCATAYLGGATSKGLVGEGHRCSMARQLSDAKCRSSG